jgi:hypothetical protein
MLSSPISLTPCSDFHYLEKSTMHETAELGVFIPGHPVECYHIKQTSFLDGGYETFNRLTWEKPGLVTLWYHALSCVGKAAATTVYTEGTFTPTVMTGAEDAKLTADGPREMYSYGTSYAAFVTSALLKPAEADAASTIFIMDRDVDSKYYRRTPAATAAQGDVWESRMRVRFKVL